MAAKTESDIESDEEFEDELVGSGPFKVRSTGVFGQLRNQFSKNRLDRVDKLLSILPTLRDHHQSHAGFPEERPMSALTFDFWRRQHSSTCRLKDVRTSFG